MSRHAATTCLACGYARTGLAGDERCPECGAHPPSSDCPTLQGWEGPPGQAWMLVAAGLLLVGFAIERLLAPTGVWWMSAAALIAGGSGIVLLLLGALSARRARPTDAAWVIEERSLLVVVDGRGERYPWDAVTEVLYDADRPSRPPRIDIALSTRARPLTLRVQGDHAAARAFVDRLRARVGSASRATDVTR